MQHVSRWVICLWSGLGDLKDRSGQWGGKVALRMFRVAAEHFHNQYNRARRVCTRRPAALHSSDVHSLPALSRFLSRSPEIKTNRLHRAPQGARGLENQRDEQTGLAMQCVRSIITEVCQVLWESGIHRPHGRGAEGGGQRRSWQARYEKEIGNASCLN